MFPFIEIADRAIPTYGLMAAAGIICGLLFVYFKSIFLKKNNSSIDPENAVFIYIFGVVGAGVGAKVLYLLLNLKSLAEAIRTTGFINAVTTYLEGGMVFYGGLFGSIIAAFITARYLKENIRNYYPSLVPGIAILAMFGRIGCFLAGCCYGKETDNFGVIFPLNSLAPSGVKLIPVQLYEALFELLAIIVLNIISARKPSVNPKLLKGYLISYALLRFCLEFFRGDLERGGFGPLSVSQWISLMLIVFLLVRRFFLPRSKSN